MRNESKNEKNEEKNCVSCKKEVIIYIYIYIYILYIYYIYILHQVSSETAFFLMVENKQSLSLSYSFHASKIILIQDDLCFLKLKPTSWSKLKRWNLWTTDAHARTKENWVLLTEDPETFWIGISVQIFQSLTKSFAYWDCL